MPDATATLPADTSRLRWIFVSSQGIRAGWSIGIFLVSLLAPAIAVWLFAHFVLHHDGKPPKILTPWAMIASDGITSLAVLFATAVLARIEKRPLLSYGLAGPRPAALFAAGLAGGFLCLSALVGVLAAGHWWVFDGFATKGAAIALYAAAWGAGFLLVGLSEEWLFRGYILNRLGRSIGFWPAALVMSLLFGAAHSRNAGEDILGLAEVVVAGLVFCLMLRLAGSLWLAIGFHAAWDWAQSFFYGTPDSGFPALHALMQSHASGNAAYSGGSVGPEGSVLSGPIMVLGLGLLLLACRGAGLLRREPAPALAA